MELKLRPLPSSETLNPLTLVPEPGPMAQLYYDARQSQTNPEGYPDGMSLVCATPVRPYAEIVADYIESKDAPGFSPLDFWNANFITPGPNDGAVTTPTGTPIMDFIQTMRPSFMKTHITGAFDFDLPYPWPGAGGRFDGHLFPQDAYFVMKGWAVDAEWSKIMDCIDGMAYEIMAIGSTLNGNSGIFRRRQGYYFSHSVRMLAEKLGQEEVLSHYLPALEREYQTEMDGQQDLLNDPALVASKGVVRMPNGSFLNRHWDDDEGPRIESYKEDVDLGELVVKGLTGATRAKRLQKFYKDMRAGAAACWDYSSRWFEDGQSILTINTTDIIPIDHNCLMVDSEETLALAYAAKARQTERAGGDAAEYWERSQHYTLAAEERKAAIHEYGYDPILKVFRDYNFVKQRQTEVLSLAMAYPLYIGMANEEQAFGVARMLRDKFLHPGGFITTLNETGEQWDGRRVWAPPNWAAIRGIARMAHILMAQGVEVEELFQISEAGQANFTGGIERCYDEHGTIPEKIDGFDPSQLIGGGEYRLVWLLNMMMETYRAMKAWNPRDPGGCLPIGRLVLAA